jgi:hypothetical protein
MSTSELQESAEAQLVLYEAADGVATLTLNRPDRREYHHPRPDRAAAGRPGPGTGGWSSARGPAARGRPRLLRGL